MGEDGARGKDWLRARGITCVLQTQFSSCSSDEPRMQFVLFINVKMPKIISMPTVAGICIYEQEKLHVQLN